MLLSHEPSNKVVKYKSVAIHQLSMVIIQIVVPNCYCVVEIVELLD